MDSRYFGESAFIFLSPGQAGQFAVGFDNTGTLGWQSGTGTQVNLATCLDDKITCNVPPEESAWANGWYSTIAYATQSTTFVGPGQTGWFVYSVRAPSGSTAGTIARFNGDLVQASTASKLRAEGYYQDAQVATTTTAATALDAEPEFQGKQIGAQATITATVTADPPTGSTTRQPVANQEVTFQVIATSSTPGGSNGNLTFTAITNSSGVASISYTRNNPGTDTVEVYVTGAPTVRDSVNVVWGTAATTISVTPDDAVSMKNGATSCRTYTVSAQTTDGLPITVNVVANFVENNPTTNGSTTNADGGAQLNGGSGDSNVAGGTNEPVAMTAPGATGPATGTLKACGYTSTATVTPVVWQDTGANAGYFASGELGDGGGSITFVDVIPTFTVTPDDTASMAVNTQRTYTLTAVDQFGAAYTGNVSLAALENVDDQAGTSAAGFVISWFDNDGTPSTGTGAGCAGLPSGTVTGVNAASADIANLNAAGLTFAICDTAAETATPIAYQEKVADNNLKEADEPGDTGGAVTYAAATLTGITLTPASGTNPTSPTGDADGADNGSLGERTYTVTTVDQSGNAFSHPTNAATVTFTVTNTGSNTIWISNCDGAATGTAIAAGASSTACVATITAGGDTTATIELDAEAANTATVSASATSGTSTFTAGPSTQTWVEAKLASGDPTFIVGSTIQGTVIFVDKAYDADGGGACTTATNDGCGAYVLQTASSGNWFITFDSTADTYTILGTTSAGTAFETALSVGDVITMTMNGATTQPAGAWHHNMTTNAP